MSGLLETKRHPSGGDLTGMGLSPEEQKVMMHLVLAMNEYSALTEPTPSFGGKSEFGSAIHECQDLLALRVVRRDYPTGGWS